MSSTTDQLYYRLVYDGTTIVFESLDDLGTYLEDFFRDPDYQHLKAVVSPVWMSEEEYAKMREFEG